MNTTAPTTPVPRTRPIGDWLTVRRDHAADVAVVHIAGEVDLCSSDAVSTAANAALDEHPAGLVIDLLEVEFCGCSGLSALVDADEHARRAHKPLLLVCRGRVVQRPLELTGLLERFRIHDSVPQAVRSLRHLALAG
jgi:anti-sigma B factor antagonist